MTRCRHKAVHTETALERKHPPRKIHNSPFPHLPGNSAPCGHSRHCAQTPGILRGNTPRPIHVAYAQWRRNNPLRVKQKTPPRRLLRWPCHPMSNRTCRSQSRHSGYPRVRRLTPKSHNSPSMPRPTRLLQCSKLPHRASAPPFRPKRWLPPTVRRYTACPPNLRVLPHRKSSPHALATKPFPTPCGLATAQSPPGAKPPTPPNPCPLRCPSQCLFSPCPPKYAAFRSPAAPTALRRRLSELSNRSMPATGGIRSP